MDIGVTEETRGDMAGNSRNSGGLEADIFEI